MLSMICVEMCYESGIVSAPPAESCRTWSVNFVDCDHVNVYLVDGDHVNVNLVERSKINTLGQHSP